MAGRAHFILLVSFLAVLCCVFEQTTAQDAQLEEIILQVEKRSVARNDEYYAEDENLEDVADRWSLEPMDLLLQFNSRKRRDAIKKRNIKAANAPGAAALVDDGLERGERSRRQADGELTKEEKRLQKEALKEEKRLQKAERKRLRIEYRERRRAQRRARKLLRKLAKQRRKEERIQKRLDRQEFVKAIRTGNEAVLERMLNIDIDMQINMNDICEHSTHHGYADVTCDRRATYRTMNGSCNNLEHTSWGSSLEPLVRWLPANYSGHGSFLPRNYHSSPREESTSFADADDGSKDKAQSGVSILIMHWGQFTDHDITHTPAAHEPCDCGTLNSSCFPLQVPGNDPVFKDRVCFEVPRTLAHCGDSKAREQFNEITAMIDASNVYGSTEGEVEYLRFRSVPGLTKKELAIGSGRLRVQEFPEDENRGALLPHHQEESGNCFGEDKKLGIVCGEAGDFRANEQPGLTSLHTIFVRLHNEIAEGLKSRNPGWARNSDRVFEEARKIVGATMQAITYNEYLPTLLGKAEYKKYIGLRYSGYDSSINPSISNVFATSGFRQGHSAVDDSLYRYQVNAEGDDIPLEPLPIAKAFFNAFYMYDVANGGIDGFMQGMIRQTARKIDRFFSQTLLNQLFVNPDESDDATGLDLLSLNILRGRDNGIQPYYRWRKYCGLSPITKWSDLKKIMTADTIAKLKKTYRNENADVQLIDPFVGFVAEKPANKDGTLGPTLSCIIGRQFKSLREGDRFFYLNPKGPQAFTKAQRDVIDKMTMARVLCQTLDNPVTFQKNVFKLADHSTNPKADCFAYNSIPKFDLDPWCVNANKCVRKEPGL
eukprot:XP_787204.3 PREDICTED: myeloperoxidase [Strongylocentrotus purpuratus]